MSASRATTAMSLSATAAHSGCATRAACETALVVGAQRPEGVSGRKLCELLLIHVVTPISTLNRLSPSRILVLTVPSGAPISAAISL